MPLSPSGRSTLEWADQHVFSTVFVVDQEIGGLLAEGLGKVAVKPRLLHVDSHFVPENRNVVKAKARVWAWLRSRPRLFWVLVPLFRSAQRVRCRVLRFAFRPPEDRFLCPDRLLSVAPSDVTYKCLLPGSALRHRGCGWVIGGDWDALEHPFVNDRRYRAVRDVVSKGSRWQDTDEYVTAVQALEGGRPVRHCRTREELDRRYEARDRLIAAIRRDGYLTQRELRRRRTREAQFGRQDEISVAISRHGDILFRDGAHRMAIAKVLGIPRVPVEVKVRHAGWAEFRQAIELHATGHGGRAPHPLPHPDLDDIPADQGFERRIRRVVESLSTPCTILDLAPGWGCGCQRLEREGFSCTALKPAPAAAYFLIKLRRACNREFAVIPRDKLDGLPEGERRFGAGLIMSDGLDAGERSSAVDALDALRSVSVCQLFVEPNAFVVPAVATGDGLQDPEGFLEELAAATGLRERARLGWSATAGPLYRLY